MHGFDSKDRQAPLVGVVVLNYNGGENSCECLCSLIRATYKNFFIVIVDNYSTDDSVQLIKKYLESQNLEYANPHDFSMWGQGERESKIVFIQAPKNGGYGYGNNMGMQYALNAGAEYVLVLNNDTVVEKGFLDPLVELCEQDESIGIAGSKIFFYDRPEVVWFDGGRFLPWLGAVKIFNFNKKDSNDHEDREITFMSGCLWLIPKKVLENVGLIRDDFFMYVEDLEFSQRVLRAGYRLKIAEQSKVWHKVGASTGGRLSVFSVYWRTRNMTQFLCAQDVFFLQKAASIFIHNLHVFFNLVFRFKFSLIRVQAHAIYHAFTREKANYVA